MHRPRHLIALLLVMLGLPLAAQDYLTVTGVVTDQQTHQPLSHVSVTADRVGTVTNEQGRFTLKVQPQTTAITFSLIGYVNRQVAISRDGQDLRVQLEQSVITMDELIVRTLNAEELVSEAIRKFYVNYSQRETSYYGFYREVMQKRRQYISISEAVVELFKTPYDKKIEFDAVAIRRGRRMMNIKSSDTLAVKLKGGPTLPIFADVVKNEEMLFYPEDRSSYYYSFSGIEKLDNRPHYVVQMTPDGGRPYALFYATLYIDQQSLAITRADLHLDMRNRAKATPRTSITLNDILDERMIELAWEGTRRQDQIRFCTFTEPTVDRYPGVPHSSLAGDYNDDKTGYTVVYPIPYSVLNLNKNLNQNPGYKK